MKFGELFEFHKIPEWYNEYFDYKKFSTIITNHKETVKTGRLVKINGIYYLTDKNFVV